jgi:hypothetical protein
LVARGFVGAAAAAADFRAASAAPLTTHNLSLLLPQRTHSADARACLCRCSYGANMSMGFMSPLRLIEPLHSPQQPGSAAALGITIGGTPARAAYGYGYGGGGGGGGGGGILTKDVGGRIRRGYGYVDELGGDGGGGAPVHQVRGVAGAERARCCTGTVGDTECHDPAATHTTQCTLDSALCSLLLMGTTTS